ncbi:MAG: hypothetical protein ISN64_01080 [Rickettsia sp.]|nr:hypothetical protein [Rickettsia sp.]
MLKILSTLIAFTLIYLIFLFLGLFDTFLKIEILEYLIELRMITFVLLFLILQLIIIIIYKIILYISNFSQKTRADKFLQKSLKKNTYIKKLLYKYSILDEQEEFSLSEINYLLEESFKKEMIELLSSYKKAKSIDNTEEQISILRKILEHTNDLSVIKGLAIILYKKEYLTESENWANKFLTSRYDKELAIMLADIKYKTSNLKDLEEILLKIKNISQNFSVSEKKKLSIFFHEIGKKYFDIDNYKAEKFLRDSFEFDSANDINLESLIKILSNNKNKDGIKELLKESFNNKPRLALIKLYKKHVTEASNEEIWEFVSKNVTEKKKIETLISITSYLDLLVETEKLKQLV